MEKIEIDDAFIQAWIDYQDKTVDDEDAPIHWTDEYLLNLSLFSRNENTSDELWDFVKRTYVRVSDNALS